MNQEPNHEIEALVAGWDVETLDISGRVAAAIGATAPAADLANEIRLMRQEMEELRRSVVVLQQELARARLEPIGRGMTRLSPYAPTESLIRLS